MKQEFLQALTEEFQEEMKSSDKLCQEIWSALTNIMWTSEDDLDMFSCSFRYAGGLIAGIIGRGDYMDWTFSGSVGKVTPDIEARMKARGWVYKSLE
jgi:hypothetical protein